MTTEPSEDTVEWHINMAKAIEEETVECNNLVETVENLKIYKLHFYL